MPTKPSQLTDDADLFRSYMASLGELGVDYYLAQEMERRGFRARGGRLTRAGVKLQNATFIAVTKDDSAATVVKFDQPAKPKPAAKPRTATTGSAADVAREHGLDPKKFRAFLRRNGLQPDVAAVKAFTK
jgi:hypothetical protein